MARSSTSLLPASESAGLPVATGLATELAAGRTGGSSEAVVVAAAGASMEGDAGGVVRGRVAVTLFVG